MPVLDALCSAKTGRYGNPYAVQRNEPPAEYDVNQMLRNDKPTKDMKSQTGGWRDPAAFGLAR